LGAATTAGAFATAAGATAGKAGGATTAAGTGADFSEDVGAGVGAGAVTGGRLAAGETRAAATGGEICCGSGEVGGLTAGGADLATGVSSTRLSFFTGRSVAAGRGVARGRGVAAVRPTAVSSLAAVRVLRAGFDARVLRRVGPAEVEVESDDADCSELRPVDPISEVSEGSAHAVPEAIAAPIPSATASAPTRPMCVAAFLAELID
jgi:hypothetical protein